LLPRQQSALNHATAHTRGRWPQLKQTDKQKVINMKNLILIISFFLITINSFAQEISDIEQAFENSWQAYEDNYAFFNMDSVDWHEQYKIYRKKVNPYTKENELISILSEMISPLKDGHSFIIKGEDFKFAAAGRDDVNEEVPRLLQDSLWNVSFRTLRKNQFQTIEKAGPKERDVPLFYYSKSNNLGYIRISRFHGTEKALFDSEYQKNDSINAIRIFDSILISMIDKQGLILDIRYNGGGNLWCYDLAERFINQKSIASYISVRKKGSYESFTDCSELLLYPNDSIKYLKPIIILTNFRTASAAERFLIALKNLPNVKVIGTYTKGKFSNSMNYTIDASKELWGTLSNERIYDSKKKCYEKIGVPADIDMINTLSNLQIDKDELIIKAIEKLNKN
jgi:C-terminal processing protease CtpA/Prc